MVCKRVIILILLCAVAMATRAQTLGEWFNQKKTQTKYLIQQIAELKVYAGLLNKGYSIAKGGLKTINDIKHGDYNLHADYFSSLKTVPPAVKNAALVADILLYQKQLIALCSQGRAFSTTDELAGSADAARTGFTGIAAEVSASIDLLSLLVTDGRVSMKDDERIRQLQTLDDDLAALYRFTQGFEFSTKQLVRQRKATQGSLNAMKILLDQP